MSGGKDSIELNIRLPAGALGSFSRLAEQLRLLLEGAGPAPGPRAGDVEAGVNPNFPEVYSPAVHPETSGTGEAVSVRADAEKNVGTAPGSLAGVDTELEIPPAAEAGGGVPEPVPAVRANGGTETGNAPAVRANAETAMDAAPSAIAGTEKEIRDAPAVRTGAETKIDEAHAARTDGNTDAGAAPSATADAETEMGGIPTANAAAGAGMENAPAVRAGAETETGDANAVRASVETEPPPLTGGAEVRNVLNRPPSAESLMQSRLFQPTRADAPQFDNPLFAPGTAGAVETALEPPMSRWDFHGDAAMPQALRALTAEDVSLAFRRDERRYDTGFPFY